MTRRLSLRIATRTSRSPVAVRAGHAERFPMATRP